MGIELVVKNLTKTFGKEVAVDDMDFTVEAGEFFAFLGPSGAGKSTTLNLIAGLEAPDSGDILVNGQSILDVRSANRDFALVFESYALYPHFTVAENMAFPLRSPARAEKYSQAEIHKMVQETARILEIEELLERYPKELSGGQKQRVGLGRALVRRPRLFLMDEPIAHLDAKLRHHMRGELKKLQSKLGITTLLATPDYHEIVAMADRAAILSQGHIEQIGSPIELFNRPANMTVANAIGDPPINLLKCIIKQQGDDYFFKGNGFEIRCNDSAVEKVTKQDLTDGVVLGIRPYDLFLVKDGKDGLIETEVYIFEPLGAEAVATLTLGDRQLKVVCPWQEKLQIGENVRLGFSLDKVHLFDRKTGEALTS
jgi:multiple sugar transport system ATP-binding protein